MKTATKSKVIEPDQTLPALPTTRDQIIDWRVSGMSVQQIAKHLHVPVEVVLSAMDDIREAVMSELERDRYVEHELALRQCDELIQGLWPDASTGDPVAAAATLKIMERKAKLLNLDEIHEDAGKEESFVEIAKTLDAKQLGVKR